MKLIFNHIFKRKSEHLHLIYKRLATMKRTFTKDEWKTVEGATEKARRLKLEENKDGYFVCPIVGCDSDAYKSQRGCRKHVTVKHGWYYYFEEKPHIEKAFPENNNSKSDLLKKARCKTFDLPYFSEDCVIAKEFKSWICSAGGGGKDLHQAQQTCKRILKFAKFCCKDVDEGVEVTKQVLEYCLGSAEHIDLFVKHLDSELGLGKAGVISYLQSLSHCLDFLRHQGIPSTKIALFMASEVFLSRAKQCLRKKMRIEWNTVLSVEHLESINCWATLAELQNVIPFYIDKYRQIIKLCKTGGGTPHDLSFATSFIVSLLFLKVKGSRPMTYQFLTMPMILSAFKSKVIDQTLFKTNEKYGFDSLVFSEEVLYNTKEYTDFVRPKLTPKCDYLLVCKKGNQLSNLGDIFGRMVYQAIGKYINPTRYRQIIETESAKNLSPEEQSWISLDQKHTSNVAKVHYQKQKSREIAKKSRDCMEKLITIGKPTAKRDLTTSLEIKEREENENTPDIIINEKIQIDSTPRRKKCPFTNEEDNFLVKGIKKYGKGKWTNILKDPEYKFHSSRKNSTLIMRAKAKKYI